MSWAMTTSVETVFGAEIMAKNYGFILNNTLTDFSFQPVRDGLPVANAPAPGKLPLSAMSPTIVFDKNNHFLLSVGSPGGPAIIDYVAQTLSGILDGKLSLKAAIDMPREIDQNGATQLGKRPRRRQAFGGPDPDGPYGAGGRPGRQRPARNHEGKKRLYRRRRPPPRRHCPGGLGPLEILLL